MEVAVSNLVDSFKGVSIRLLRKERPDVQNHYWKGALWSPSYFALSFHRNQCVKFKLLPDFSR